MSRLSGGNYYEQLGARPLINAEGNASYLGGSLQSAAIKEAMDEASQHFVDMSELLAKAGDFIAGILGTEAAYPTAGCAAAISQSVAACMTGDDYEKMARLPDTTGMKNEILIQKCQRYHFDPCFRFSGARLVEVGDEKACTADQLEHAIGPNTAAIAYYQQPDWGDSVVSLEDAVTVGRRNDVPVIADAASQIYPLEHFRKTVQTADLACFSGKYYGGTHSSGFVAGRRDLIDDIVAQDFTGEIPYSDIPGGVGYASGRSMKLDRQDIIGLVVAIDWWFSTNHEDRIAGYERKMSVIKGRLAGIPGVEAKLVPHPFNPYLVTMLEIRTGPDATRSVRQVRDELDAGTPRIKARLRPDGEVLEIVTNTLYEGEETIIAERLSSLLTA